MTNGTPKPVEVITARALRVALDRSLSRDDAVAILAPVCRGRRAAATLAVGRLERVRREHDDEMIRRAVAALRTTLAALPDEPDVHGPPNLELVPPARRAC